MYISGYNLNLSFTMQVACLRKDISAAAATVCLLLDGRLHDDDDAKLAHLNRNEKSFYMFLYNRPVIRLVALLSNPFFSYFSSFCHLPSLFLSRCADHTPVLGYHLTVIVFARRRIYFRSKQRCRQPFPIHFVAILSCPANYLLMMTTKMMVIIGNIIMFFFLSLSLSPHPSSLYI